VIAHNANWAAGASDRATAKLRDDFYRAVQKAVDDEAGTADVVTCIVVANWNPPR
jgi:hypothetical protein